MITRRIVVESALVLAVGVALATSGGATAALSLAGFDAAPVQAASPPGCVVVTTPGVQVSCEGVATGGAVAGRSVPTRCVDVATPATRVTVGSASAPGGCVVVQVPGTVGGHSVPVGSRSAPVGASSAPRCVSVSTPGADVRTGC